jgi:type II secretory pathway component GspD/PulD (secretin)
VPLAGRDAPDQVQISGGGERFDLVVRNAPLGRVLTELAASRSISIVFADDLVQHVSITLYGVTLEDALNAILPIAGYQWASRNGIIHVSSLTNAVHIAPEVQGRELRVFNLDFVSAADLLEPVQALLSPAGTVHILQTNEVDSRRAQETLVVEDLPSVIDRVSQYLVQIDQPPRQVMIQVHVLQVSLTDDMRHGINIQHLFNISDTTIELQTAGFANSVASPAALFSLDGPQLNSLIEMLKTTTDAKTLASPRVLVVNGQSARIQVGEQLGFRVTTTTETSTLESVEFLDVGVVLRVTPHISRDGRVMMYVMPEVSSGRVNPDTGLPEEETTEVETAIMLGDGQGMVIGGLIQEDDRIVQTRVPVLGDARWIGRLFQKNQVVKERSEVIIALIPHILPYGPENAERECLDMVRATTPLLQGPLIPFPRPWEPQLANPNPRLFRLPTIWGGCEPCDPEVGEPPAAPPLELHTAAHAPAVTRGANLRP